MSLLSDLRSLNFWKCEWLMDDGPVVYSAALPAPDEDDCESCGFYGTARRRPEQPRPTPVEHRMPSVSFPENFGLKAWDFDPLLATHSGNPMALGALHFARLSINAPTQVCALHLAIASPSGTLTEGACFAGIYDATGALVAQTGDISGSFALATIPALPLLHKAALSPGTYFLALLLNGADAPLTWSAPLSLTSMPMASGEAAEFFMIPGPLDALPMHADFSSIESAMAAYWAALS